MPRIRLSEVVSFLPQQMYDLVVDVERYPQFLPWCVATRKYDVAEDRFMAEMVIAFHGLRESFVTEDRIEPGRKVEVNLKSGPFQYLVSTWTFAPAAGERTRVDFFIDFRFKSALKEMAMGPVFTMASKQMLAAFKERAGKVYGSRG
ncbi:MAG: type II toxin-antitoxin system RatA family toxin [Magnetococcales bacterium]|nr:type II toxin-antitoxin system RatA family toxin [Magnetococcales bacterium]